MAEIEFSRFTFQTSDDDSNLIKVIFGGRYSFNLSLRDLKDIDEGVIVEKQKIIFPNAKERQSENKLDILLSQGMKNMTHLLNKKDVVYIDEASGIPLVGAIDFGVVDRGTNILEVKPLTGCNLNCIYCSVDEGVNKKSADILIDDTYLVNVCAELAAKKTHPVEFNIGPHGEPLLYPFNIDLIKGLKEIPNCEVISMNTNGTLLTKEFIDQLKDAGLTRLNWSLNTVDEEVATALAAKPFPMKKTLDLIDYSNSIGLYVQLAPLTVPEFNDDLNRDIIPVIELSKTLKSPFPVIGFQKFLCNKGGRNPVEEVPFEDYFNMLRPLGEKYDLVLTPKKDYNPFNIFVDKTLEKTMLKNQIVKARIASKGRTPNEKFCVAHDRVIRVKGLLRDSGSVSIKIVRDKHNIYLGVPV